MEIRREVPNNISRKPNNVTSFISSALYHAMSLMGMFGCGTIIVGNDTLEVHDYKGTKLVMQALSTKTPVEYDPNVHGSLHDWLDEGEALINSEGEPMRKKNSDKIAVHRHVHPGDPKFSGISGVHAYSYE